jgi:hypothetical protein
MAARTEEIDERQSIEEALAVWRRRTSKALSAEDASVIIRNVTGFFGILAQWEAVERIAANSCPAVQGDQTNEQG